MNKILTLLCLIIFSFTLYVNYLAGAGYINNVNTGEVSGRFPTLFTPAGFTFAIWGIIYLLNLIFVLFQLYKAFRRPQNLDPAVNGLFILICLTNTVWIFSWHQFNTGLALALMLVILVLLIAAYQRVRSASAGSGNYFFEYINFSVYLSWISVATIANTAIYLTSTGLSLTGLAPAMITVAMIAVAALIAGYLAVNQGNIWYGLVTLWASYGILMARSADDSDGADLVAIGALAAMFGVFASIAYAAIKKRIGRS